MKQVLAINVHSFIDVITNSSTEIFICNTDKTIESVDGILRGMLEDYNAKENEERVFEEIFDAPFLYTQEMFDKKHKEYGWGYERKENIGKIFIRSTDDNSIPYDLWDTINGLFNAHNEHLG